MTSENCLAIFRDKVREHLHWQDAQEYLALLASYKKWKICDEMVNIRHNNGVGGYDADSPELNLFNPTISDFRGNILAYYNAAGGTNVWNAARPTGYGAVPGYRPVALAYSANVPQASAWRGHWPDITGYYHIGLRDLNPVTGGWMSSDSVWNERDPNWYTFAGGDPVMGFDADGRLATALVNYNVGVAQGLLQASTGISAGNPTDTANYNGQLTGRDLSAVVSAWLTAQGGATTGGGAAVMAGSLTVEVGSGGTASLAAGPAFVGGAVTTAIGAAETGVGAIGLYNFMNLTPLQSPSNDSGGGGSAQTTNPSASQVPQNANDVLDYVNATGEAPDGYQGGGIFQNDGRAGTQVLPTTDASGNPITYTEYDVNPYSPGVNRGTDRLVTGSDGSAYYTGDHYETFTQIQ